MIFRFSISNAQDTLTDLLINIGFEDELVNTGQDGSTPSSNQTLEYSAGPSLTAGKALDASIGGVKIATGFERDISTRTVSCWINSTEIVGAGRFGNGRNVAFSQDDIPLDQGILRGDFTNGQMRLLAGGSSSMLILEAEANTWYHVVLVQDQTVSRYYVNGEFRGSLPLDTESSSIDPNPRIVLGSGRSTTNQFFEGVLDDIKIYNRALTDCEISDITSFVSSSSDILTLSGIMVFPNPVSQNMIVLLPTLAKNAVYKIYSTSGKLPQQGKVTNQIHL